MESRNNIKILLICILILFQAILILNSVNNNFQSPDENDNKYLSKQYSQTGKFSYVDYLNNNLKYAIVHPRGFFEVGGSLVSVFPVGLPMIYGTYLNLLGANLVPLFLTIGLLLIAFSYLFFRTLFGEKKAIVSVTLISFSVFLVPFLIRVYMSEAIASLFFMGGIFYLFKDEEEYRNLLLSGLFFGVSILISYRMVFFVGIIGILHILFNFKSLNLKKIFSFLIPFLIVLFILFYTNNSLYGDFLKTGYSSQSDYASIQGAQPRPLFYIDLQKMIFNISKYFFALPFFGILGVLGMTKVSKKNEKKYVLFIGVILVISFLYFSNIATAGSDSFSLGSSFLRYLLLSFILLTPLYVIFIQKSISNKAIIFLLFCFLIVSAIMFANDNGGISSQSSYSQATENLRQEILNKTPINALIVTAYYDKIIFPERKVIDISLLPGYYENDIWKINKTVLMEELCKTDSPVYIFLDSFLYSEDIKTLVNIAPCKINYREILANEKFYELIIQK